MENLVINRVRRALGRTESLAKAPVPPPIDEHIVRLVASEIGLPELFQKRAEAMKMLVELMRVDDLFANLSAFLREKNCKSVMLSDTPLLEKLRVAQYLKTQGFNVKTWREISADAAYDFDAGVTEADYVVAETGTLVMRHRPENGRLLSLVPFVHVAVVEPKMFVADLVDLFQRLAKAGTGSGVTLISGPSKTADIEMITVTGVHGPNVVKTYVLA